MKTIITLAILFVFTGCQHKNATSETEINQNLLKSPSTYFPEKRAKILVVGTFHFNYPGLDVNKTDEKDKIDVLVEPKKTELLELVNYIEQFKPTKIAIEAVESWNANDKLKKYKKGEFHDHRDERFQIAMRIAVNLGIDSLYSVDSDTYLSKIETLSKKHYDSLIADFDFKSDDPYDEMAVNWIQSENKMKSEIPLLDFFKHINSKESHQYDYGSYLIGDFKLDDMRGADILSVWWYNRNLRIFRKTQQITESDEDRILLVIGNGHASILRQLFECSPEFEFIEFDSL